MISSSGCSLIVQRMGNWSVGHESRKGWRPGQAGMAFDQQPLMRQVNAAMPRVVMHIVCSFPRPLASEVLPVSVVRAQTSRRSA